MLFVNSSASPFMDSVSHRTMPGSESSEAHFKNVPVKRKRLLSVVLAHYPVYRVVGNV